MTPQRPYDHPAGYRWRWVWTGWDGVNRTIDRDGTVRPPRPAGGAG